VLNEILVQESLTWACCGVDVQLQTPGTGAGVRHGGGPATVECDMQLGGDAPAGSLADDSDGEDVHGSGGGNSGVHARAAVMAR
jgi:hypothetical protein